jgi:menaquinone-dependent protoporphyrinogen oxidase
MNILVTYASKHGSTEQIARVIHDDLHKAGFDVTFLPAEQVESLENVDAVILGSAIYIGQWQQSATDLIYRMEDELKELHVWLFSSGPIGIDPFPREEPPVTAELVQRIGAIDHQSFMGKLDRSHLGLGERLITTVMRAPEGDFRDWDAIHDWASYIGRTLSELGAKLNTPTV